MKNVGPYGAKIFMLRITMINSHTVSLARKEGVT
jgi:hypothetical protein